MNDERYTCKNEANKKECSIASQRRGLGNGTDSGNLTCATARFTTKTAAPQSCSPSGPRRSWRLARALSARQLTDFEFAIRDRWEFYHAVGTFMSIVALSSVTASTLSNRTQLSLLQD